MDEAAALRGFQAVTVGLCKQMIAAGVRSDELESSRVLVINTWRSIGAAPVRRQPLVLVDTRSVDADDVAPIEMPAGIMGGSALRLTYARPSARHRWHWFEEMRPDELLIFAQYDSARERSCRMLHSAVHHPDTPADAEPRHSIEMRLLCLLPAEREG